MGTSLYFSLLLCMFEIFHNNKWKRNSQRKGRKENVARGWLCILWADCRDKIFYLLGTSPSWRGRERELFSEPCWLSWAVSSEAELKTGKRGGEMGPGWQQGQQEWQLGGGWLKNMRGSGICWLTPEAPLHPSVFPMPSIFGLASLQESFIAIIMRSWCHLQRAYDPSPPLTPLMRCNSCT